MGAGAEEAEGFIEVCAAAHEGVAGFWLGDAVLLRAGAEVFVGGSRVGCCESDEQCDYGDD